VTARPHVDQDGRLHWAAAAAMTAVSADLPDMPAALLLSYRRVHVDNWISTGAWTWRVWLSTTRTCGPEP
jgi:hypothetical protein